MTASELPGWLVDRVRREPSPDIAALVVPGSTPVVCFGDQQRAAVATLGINPPWGEFRRLDGGAWAEQQRRLPTLESLGAHRLRDLSDKQVERHLEGCYGYFERNPSWTSFGYLEPVLARLGCSFRDRTACHLDLVQWATQPVWSLLDQPAQQRLLATDAPFLRDQLTWDRAGRGPLELVLVNGRSAVEQCRQVGVAWEPARSLQVGERTTRFWTAFWQGVTLAGWSANLPDAWAGRALRERLPDHVAGILDELGWSGRGQRVARRSDVAEGRPAVALPARVREVLESLRRSAVPFTVDVVRDGVELRREPGAEAVVHLHTSGLSVRLDAREARRLLEVCPAGRAREQTGWQWVHVSEASLRGADVRTFLLTSAGRALAGPPQEDPDEPLAADELVEAVLESARCTDWPEDLAAYWRERQEVLLELLTRDLPPLPAHPETTWRGTDQDRSLLLDLLSDAAHLHLAEHQTAFDELLEQRDAQLRSILLDVLERAFPGVRTRRTHVGELLARGPAQPPGDDDPPVTGRPGESASTPRRGRPRARAAL